MGPPGPVRASGCGPAPLPFPLALALALALFLALSPSVGGDASPACPALLHGLNSTASGACVLAALVTKTDPRPPLALCGCVSNADRDLDALAAAGCSLDPAHAAVFPATAALVSVLGGFCYAVEAGAVCGSYGSAYAVLAPATAQACATLTPTLACCASQLAQGDAATREALVTVGLLSASEAAAALSFGACRQSVCGGGGGGRQSDTTEDLEIGLSVSLAVIAVVIISLFVVHHHRRQLRRYQLLDVLIDVGGEDENFDRWFLEE